MRTAYNSPVSADRDHRSRLAGLAQLASMHLWLAIAATVSALSLRFGMRAVGVRDDIPFPGLIYSVTAPLVQPFYRYFPVSDRFDHDAIEVASLVAAASVLLVALGIYAAGLLLFDHAGTRGR